MDAAGCQTLQTWLTTRETPALRRQRPLLFSVEVQHVLSRSSLYQTCFEQKRFKFLKCTVLTAFIFGAWNACLLVVVVTNPCCNVQTGILILSFQFFLLYNLNSQSLQFHELGCQTLVVYSSSMSSNLLCSVRDYVLSGFVYAMWNCNNLLQFCEASTLCFMRVSMTSSMVSIYTTCLWLNNTFGQTIALFSIIKAIHVLFGGWCLCEPDNPC